jgi:hypothetical protein
VRELMLGGRRVTLTLRVCDAGGVTWALAHADVGDPGQVDSMLRALRQAALANLGVADGPSLAAPAVPGQTPQAASGQWQVEGRRPDGQALRARLVVFAKGTQVAQATALGARLDAGAMDSFFGGLRALP